MIFQDTDYVLEPANVQTLRCVRSINIANFPRQVVLPPEGVTDTETYGTFVDFVENYAVINAEGITGDVPLIAGWNCDITTKKNDVTIHASAGAGRSVCEIQPGEVSVTHEESYFRQTGYGPLSRGLLCRDLLSSINGLYGPDIPLIVGSGITMTTAPGVITLTLTESAGDKDCDMPECVHRVINNASS